MGMNIMRMKGRAKMMRTIKVTGKGKIAVKPDMIRLYVNKEELCHEYEDTLRRSTEDTELLKDLFEKLGFQRKDLKTVYFNVDTEYESYQDRDKSWKRRFEGYKYIHHMKIEFASDNIIKNFYFLDPSKYERSSQYAQFMKQVTTYTRSGKVAHDDAPDSLSLLENEIRKLGNNKVEVFQRPF